MSTSQDASEGLLDDSDPTYTHFAHRDEFLSLLKRILSYDLAEDTSGDRSSNALKKARAQEEEEDGIVKLMGAIVCCFSSREVLTVSSTTIFLYHRCLTQLWIRLSPH
jgi:hypothetical protein